MNRYITVPKDKSAEIALDYDEAVKEQLLEIELTESDINKLWEMGLFATINSLTGSNIDVYETESIFDIDMLRNVLESGIFDNRIYAGIDHVAKIKDLFQEALKRKTSIHFFL
ncbi:MAG: hypothetical protein KDC07_11300 [Chitinophagaceae bacterium]|nr:hypothetical protein [Chitinophagaceae bacterium]